ncbi:MAG: bifunctional methylenetetrahydrofolate dehydrogenase/methenyltetrahydrofolate cyclohydrolase FolD [Spirochaetales bacterium]|nr:bifunctional methylenetetrahydrofolate dehydrogenase/methenyltetrahydrofolate cyclohydrolase FolD [Spirochaetales bacterium]
MKATIIDGKAIAGNLRNEIKLAVENLKKQGIVPGLGVVLVGDDPASLSYVTAKEKACEENGIYSREIRKPASLQEKELLGIIQSLNEDPAIHGILVQLPLPKHIREEKIIEAISPEKDVDGFHPASLGRMMTGQDTFLPCTPNGVLQILKSIGASPAGRHVTIVGRSNIVGKPLANMLLAKGEWGDATVTVCHSRTPDLAEYTRRADILIAAVGQAQLITPEMVKPGAVVIDVGVNRVPDSTKKSGFRLVGDVDFHGVQEIAAAITPVPGGVGPLTITMLLYNTVQSAQRVGEQAQ